MLLTCGICGVLTFVAFYVSIVTAVLRSMKNDALLQGVFAALIGYIAVMMFNVAQPILIMTYFSMCGFGVSRIRYLAKKGGVHHES